MISPVFTPPWKEPGCLSDTDSSHINADGEKLSPHASALDENKFLKDRVVMVMHAMRVMQEPCSSLDEEQLWTLVRVAWQCERKS
jgi:hypothetical protein